MSLVISTESLCELIKSSGSGSFFEMGEIICASEIDEGHDELFRVYFVRLREIQTPISGMGGFVPSFDNVGAVSNHLRKEKERAKQVKGVQVAGRGSHATG